ncbi:unnamed protein product, partial [Prorocentrum cordatum]
MPAATTMYPFTCCAFLISFPVALVANPGIDDASHRLSLPAEIQCLIWQGDENGCGAIRNKELCLRSVDGRPWRQWRGHKIYGQPCAWCDGDNCTANDDKVCMPADWVKDQPWVTVANCSRPSDRTVIERVPQVQAAAAAAGSVGLQDAGHPDFACGAPHAAASSMANNFFYTFTAGSLDQCKLLCSSKKYCQGLEYQARDGVCMLWWNTIQSMEPKLGHTCAPTRSGQEDCQVHPRTRRQHQRLRLGRGWPLRGRFYQYHDLDQLEPDVHQRPAGASWHGAGGGSRTGGVGGRGAEGPARGRPQQGSAELRRPGHAQHAHHDRGQSRQCQLDSCRGRQLDADFHQREQHYQRE